MLLTSGDLPLTVKLPRPDMVGVDRLLDGLAANRLRTPGRPAVVVDVGLAITVDLLDADGAFLGGAILPGIAMSARALHEFTDLLPQIDMAELAEPPPALGTATVAAMRSGLFWGAVGAVRQLVEQLTGNSDAEVFLTGGAGPVVAQLMGTAARYVPHLTLAGIALADSVTIGKTCGISARSIAPEPGRSMKVACFTALRQIELVDAPEPVLQRPGDVLLQIDRVGICGSDVHYYLEGRIGDQVLQYPATLGHECSGTVLETGPAVQGLKAGDRVAVDPAFPCGTCDQCLSGRAHTCRRLLFMGSPGQAPGAAAERYVAPAACCAAVPASMSLDEAMLVEPLSIGLHAVRLSQLAAGMKIAILGAGPIGLSVLLCAKATAPCTVLVTDLLDDALRSPGGAGPTPF